jgi:sialate O-acetylesterase
VAGYRIRGVLWDQGESRSGVVGVEQDTMMSELIRGWREAWAQGDFPFIFVQKPSGGGCAFSNDDPITRNGDRFVATLPDIAKVGSGEQRFLYVRLMHDNENTWMVPASDLGSGVHPTNKWGYGNRAAEVALSQVYETGVQAYGPIYRNHEIDGSKVVIKFDQVGKGLTAVHARQLQGFALAGADGDWRWAKARIDGDTVVVWSENVTTPTRVRYAFAQKRQWANLFNKNGLPALAFEAGK